MTTYRVALIGCGNRGAQAARAYHAHPRTEVVGLCDLVQERLDALGDELQVSARYSDLDAMIEQTRPEIVAIPTGTEFHYDLLMRALEHGVNIDVEKPICINLDQVDAVVAKARDKGVRIAVHHQERVGRHMRAVERAFGEGRIGELRYVSGSGKGYYGGYGLLNIGVHMLSHICKFAGRCLSVSATALTDGRPITPEDVVPSPNGMGTIAGEHITATLQFDGNLTGSLLQHRFREVDNAGYGMELYGTQGRLFWSADGGGWSGAWWLPQPHCVPGGERDRWQPLESQHTDGYDPSRPASSSEYAFVEEYVAALDEGRDHESSGYEGRRVMEIMMGIFESAAFGRRVELPQQRRDHPLLRWRREHGLQDPAPMPRPYVEWLAAEDMRLGRAEPDIR